jgi:hypothetical protein
MALLYKMLSQCCYLNGDVSEYFEAVNNIGRCLSGFDLDSKFASVFGGCTDVISFTQFEEMISGSLGEDVIHPPMVVGQMYVELQRREREDELTRLFWGLGGGTESQWEVTF